MTDEIKKKLWIYSLIIVFFGLLQVWGGTIIYGLGDKPFSFWQFLTQYGIYFFASSLTASSWWKHFKLFKNIDLTELAVSTVAAFVFIILLIFVYFSGLRYNDIELKYEFYASSKHQFIAFISILISLSYGVFTEKRTFDAKSTNQETKPA